MLEIKIMKAVSVIGNEKVKVKIITEGAWGRRNVWQAWRKEGFEVPRNSMPKEGFNKKKGTDTYNLVGLPGN